MKTRFWLAAFAAAALCAGSAPAAQIVQVNTSIAGNQQVLDSLVIDRGQPMDPQTLQPGDLKTIDVIHFQGETSSVLAVPTGDPNPSIGNRAALLDGDFGLNSGLINPGVAAGGSTIGLSSDPVLRLSGGAGPDGTPGMGFTFTEPVFNNPGIDVVLFEIDSQGGPSAGDAFWLSPLDFSQEPDLQSVFYDGNDYDTFAGLAAFGVRTITAPNIDALENNPVGGSGSNTTFDWYVIGLDLSDLGYDPGAQVDGLFLQAGDSSQVIDPTLIFGLGPAEVPEPSTIGLLGIGLIGLLRRHRRR